MELKIVGKQEVFRASELVLTLEQNAVSLLHITLQYEGKETVEDISVLKRDRASVSIGDQELECVLYGKHNNQEGLPSVVALLLGPEGEEWFHKPINTGKPILYQKDRKEEGGPFLKRILQGNHDALWLHPEQIGLLKDVFEGFATLYRPAGLSNLEFLDQLCLFLRHRQPKILGWAGFPGQQPLKLLSHFEDELLPMLSLTQNTPWDAPASTEKIGFTEFNSVRGMEGSFELERAYCGEDLASIFVTLCKKGEQTKAVRDGLKGMADTEKKQLIMLPGVVRVDGQPLFCRRVVYTYTHHDKKNESGGNKGKPSLKARVQLVPLPSRCDCPWQPKIFEARFRQWSEEQETPKKKDGQEGQEAYRPYVLLDTGIVANPQNENDPAKGLHARLLTPLANFKSNPAGNEQKFEGLYFRHRKDDPLLYLLWPGETPVALGHYQHYNKVFEESKLDVALNVPHFGVTVSGKTVELSQANGLQVNANTEKSLWQMRKEDAVQGVFLDAKEQSSALEAKERVRVQSDKELQLQAKEKTSLMIENTEQVLLDTKLVLIAKNVEITDSGTTMKKNVRIKANLDVE